MALQIIAGEREDRHETQMTINHEIGRPRAPPFHLPQWVHKYQLMYLETAWLILILLVYGNMSLSC